MKGTAREEELLIEFPDTLPEIEEEIPEQQEQPEQPMTNEAAPHTNAKQPNKYRFKPVGTGRRVLTKITCAKWKRQNSQTM